MIGTGIALSIVEDLEKMGIELSNESQAYSLREIREGFDTILGTEAAELLMQRIRKILYKNH